MILCKLSVPIGAELGSNLCLCCAELALLPAVLEQRGSLAEAQRQQWVRSMHGVWSAELRCLRHKLRTDECPKLDIQTDLF